MEPVFITVPDSLIAQGVIGNNAAKIQKFFEINTVFKKFFSF